MRSLVLSLACWIAAFGILATTPESADAFWPISVNGSGSGNVFGRPAFHGQTNGFGVHQTGHTAGGNGAVATPTGVSRLWFGSSGTTVNFNPITGLAMQSGSAALANVFSPYAGFRTAMNPEEADLMSLLMGPAADAAPDPWTANHWSMDSLGRLWFGNGLYTDGRNIMGFNGCDRRIMYSQNIAPKRRFEAHSTEAEGKADRDAADKAATLEKAEQQLTSDEGQVKRKESEKLLNNEKDAATLLRFAQQFIDSNDRERAVKQLDAIIAKYSKTNAAAEAKKLLKNLRQ